jgi:diacylglycerol kinase (ATP)
MVIGSIGSATCVISPKVVKAVDQQQSAESGKAAKADVTLTIIGITVPDSDRPSKAKTGQDDSASKPTHPLRRILRSFGFASAGIANMIRYQTNAWVHLAATTVLVGLGIWLELNRIEICFLVIAAGFVWSMEAVNTAIELLADALHPEQHPLIGRAKDAAAGGVLLAAVTAALVGVMVLLPPLMARLGIYS